MYPVALN